MNNELNYYVAYDSREHLKCKDCVIYTIKECLHIHSIRTLMNEGHDVHICNTCDAIVSDNFFKDVINSWNSRGIPPKERIIVSKNELCDKHLQDRERYIQYLIYKKNMSEGRVIHYDMSNDEDYKKLMDWEIEHNKYLDAKN